MSDDFLNTNDGNTFRVYLELKVINRWKETIIFVHCNKSVIMYSTVWLHVYGLS